MGRIRGAVRERGRHHRNRREGRGGMLGIGRGEAATGGNTWRELGHVHKTTKGIHMNLPLSKSGGEGQDRDVGRQVQGEDQVPEGIRSGQVAEKGRKG